MKTDILQGMLLIPEPSAFKLYEELMNLSKLFVAPAFMIALILEYLGQMDFGSVVKKLFVVTIAMTFFYQLHTEGVKLAFQGANSTMDHVSTNNLFVKEWTKTKMTTRTSKDWSWMSAFAVPNLNDLVATAFFVLSKIFIWILKLIYTTVYHLTYIFAPITAVLYFFGWTNSSLKGSVQASIWCMLMPFVVMVVLVLVGNSMDQSAKNSELILGNIDTIVWLFGVTLLLLITPVITLGLVRGDGVHSLGTKVGALSIGAGLQAGMFISSVQQMGSKGWATYQKTKSKMTGGKERLGGRSEKSNSKSSQLTQSSDRSEKQERDVGSKQEIKESGQERTKEMNSSNSNSKEKEEGRFVSSASLQNKKSSSPLSYAQAEQRKEIKSQNYLKEVGQSRTKLERNQQLKDKRSKTQNKETKVERTNARPMRKERQNELR